MTVLVLDSGAVSALAERSPRSLRLIAVLQRDGLWPPVVPSPVLVESVTGRVGADTNTNRLLAICQVTTQLPEWSARRAARLRYLARRGSAVDAVVVEAAEPGGTVLTGDRADLEALAAHAVEVTVRRI